MRLLKRRCRRMVCTDQMMRARPGNSWIEVQNMIWRPFYFANLIVDPKNENKIYKPDGPLIASSDAGGALAIYPVERMETFSRRTSCVTRHVHGEDDERQECLHYAVSRHG